MQRIGPPGFPASAGSAPAAVDALSPAIVASFVARAAASLTFHAALLDRLDAALGDGDHGANMTTGFGAAVATATACGTAHPDDVGECLRVLGHSLVASVGGASGPLYGTVFIEAGFRLGGLTEAGPAAVADALEAGRAGLVRRGRCAVGDKTILDALDPAVGAVRRAVDSGAPLAECLAEATIAAASGMRATIPLVARRGLALRLGERSRGHRDPGATSCFLLVAALARAAGVGRAP